MESRRELQIIQKKLLYYLGRKYDIYFEALRQWFLRNISKRQLDFILRSRLTHAQIRIHNEFVLALVKISKNSKNGSNTIMEIFGNMIRSYKWKGSTYDRMTTKLLQDRLSLKKTYEPIFPDEKSIYNRFTFSAPTYGVSGAADNACRLIEAACVTFAKNIISAVVARKSGFKLYRRKLMYNYGMPAPDPWLINTVNYNCRTNYSTKICATGDGSYVKIPDRKKFERDILFQLTTANSHMTQKSPIFIDDMIDTLRVHKHVIPQTVIYSLFMHKLLLLRCRRSSWDQPED